MITMTHDNNTDPFLLKIAQLYLKLECQLLISDALS